MYCFVLHIFELISIESILALGVLLCKVTEMFVVDNRHGWNLSDICL